MSEFDDDLEGDEPMLWDELEDQYGRLTLPLKNVSLAEWFNSDKENGNDENIKGALHARIQARGSSLGGQLKWTPESRQI